MVVCLIEHMWVHTDTSNSCSVLQSSYEISFIIYSYLLSPVLRISLLTDTAGDRIGLPHKTVLSCSVVSDSLRPCGLQPTRLFCPWDSPGKYTGVGCHFLPQGVFHTQGLNPYIRDVRVLSYTYLHWQAGSLPLAPPVKVSRSPEENGHLNSHRFGYDKSTWTKKTSLWLVGLADTHLFPHKYIQAKPV